MCRLEDAQVVLEVPDQCILLVRKEHRKGNDGSIEGFKAFSVNAVVGQHAPIRSNVAASS